MGINSGACIVSKQNCNLQQCSVGFLGERILKNTENREKTQQQTQPRYNIAPGIRTIVYAVVSVQRPADVQI